MTWADGVVWSLGKPAWKSDQSASNHDAELCCDGKVVSHFIFKKAIVRKLDRSDTLYLGDGASDSLAFNARPLLAAILMPLSSMISLLIVGLGMRCPKPPVPPASRLIAS